MYFEFSIQVEIERTEGKFMSREEAAEVLMQELDNDPGSIEGSDGGSYEVVNFEVQEIEQVKPMPRKKLIEALMPAIQVITGTSDKVKAEQFLTLLEASGRRVV